MPFYYTLYHQHYAWAFTIFVLAGFSDGLDGFLARKFQCTSVFGAIADPIADKALVISSFVIMCYLEQIPVWLLSIVVLKDAVVVGGVLFARYRLGHINYYSTFISKLNTTCQLALIAFALFELAYFNILPEPWFDIGIMIVAVTGVMTIASYVTLGWKTLFKRVPA